MAVVLDVALGDVPARYRDPERAERLVGVLADAVRPGGLVVAPAAAWELQDYAREVGCRVAVFAVDAPPSRRDRKVACQAAWTAGGRLLREAVEGVVDHGPLRPGVAPAVQAAVLLAATALPDRDATPSDAAGRRHAAA
jgi:hypothetical protein